MNIPFEVVALGMPPIELPSAMKTDRFRSECECGYSGTARSKDAIAAIREDHDAWMFEQKQQGLERGLEVARSR
jgi:hypothetical protein